MTLTLTSRTGADGRLRLDIPMDRPNREFEVEVTVREPKFQLPPNYFDVLGSITDETFERPRQGNSLTSPTQ